MQMFAKSKRTGKYGEILSKDAKNVTIEVQGLPPKKLTVAEFEKNFVEVPDDEGRAVIYAENKGGKTMPTRSDVANTKPADVATAVDAVNTQKPAPKTEAKKSEPKPVVDHILWTIAKNFVEGMGENYLVAPEGKTKGFRSFKVNGNMFCNITYNRVGITLWVRKEAVKGLKFPDGITLKEINHMFDGRISISENNPANVKFIQDVLKASAEFQIQKKANTKKAQAAAKAAAKAEKKATEAKAKESENKAKAEAKPADKAPTTKPTAPSDK